MRFLGLAGLVVALAIVALLASKQIGGSASSVSARTGEGAREPNAPSAPQGTPKQIEQQFKQSLDAAMQTPRPMPDEAR